MNDFTLSVRTAVPRDLPLILAIEAETFGHWTSVEFERALTSRRLDCYVATARAKGDQPHMEQVIGFAVIEFGKYQAFAINMAATLPEARKALIEKMEKRAERHQLELVWEDV